MRFHIIYTTKTGKVIAKDFNFNSFVAAEEYLESIEAQYWEIGFNEKEIKERL